MFRVVRLPRTRAATRSGAQSARRASSIRSDSECRAEYARRASPAAFAPSSRRQEWRRPQVAQPKEPFIDLFFTFSRLLVCLRNVFYHFDSP